MKLLRLKLKAIWSPRQEQLSSCMQLLHSYFAELCACDRSLCQWFEGARSKKKALERPVDVCDVAVIKWLLLKGRNRTDIGKKVIEELGFHVGLWNGGSTYEEEGGIDVQCGCYSRWLGETANNVRIDFPIDLRGLAQRKKMAEIVRLTAKTWHPDSISVASLEAQDARNFTTHPFVDWMLYLPECKYQVPASIPAAHVERLEGLGTIIVVQEEPPDPENPEHTRNIERVREALGL